MAIRPCLIKHEQMPSSSSSGDEGELKRVRTHLDWSVPFVLVLVVAGRSSSATSALRQLRFFLWYCHHSVFGFFQPGALLSGAFLTPTHLDRSNREETKLQNPGQKNAFGLLCY